MAAVGPATARRSPPPGCGAGSCPAEDEQRQEGLPPRSELSPAGTRVLFPQALGGREHLRDGSSRAGSPSTSSPSRRPSRCRPAAAARLRRRDLRQPLGAARVRRALGRAPARERTVAVIGPTTAAAAREAGVDAARVRDDATPEALVAALVAARGARAGRASLIVAGVCRRGRCWSGAPAARRRRLPTASAAAEARRLERSSNLAEVGDQRRPRPARRPSSRVSTSEVAACSLATATQKSRSKVAPALFAEPRQAVDLALHRHHVLARSEPVELGLRDSACRRERPQPIVEARQIATSARRRTRAPRRWPPPPSAASPSWTSRSAARCIRPSSAAARAVSTADGRLPPAPCSLRPRCPAHSPIG